LAKKNAELDAVNEELRSLSSECGRAHEQLERSRGETQSLYEELKALTCRYREEVAPLRADNDDLTQALTSTGIATIFLDTHMHIRRFTPACTHVVRLTGSDIGRPLSHIQHVFGGTDLQSLVEELQIRQEPTSTELRADDGSWFSIRATAHRGHGGCADGTVVTFTDVTDIKKSEERFRRLVEHSPAGISIGSTSGDISYCNDALLRMLGFDREEIRRQRARWSELTLPECAFRDAAARKELEEHGACIPYEKEIQSRDGRRLSVLVGESVISREPETDAEVAHVVVDLTRLRSVEHELRQIEWLLTRGVRSPIKQCHADREYLQDAAALDKSGEILRTSGREMLEEIVDDYLDLLDTSAAVMEKDGSYALRVFTSSWCRFLHNEGRQICSTAACDRTLANGSPDCRRSCHAGCRRAIDTGKPTDIACEGDIRFYAVPIRADGETVGAIAFGYGNPPTEPDRLRSIATRHGVSPEVLATRSQAYSPRPHFIIELAKKRLEGSARFIGAMVERGRAWEQLQRARDDVESTVVVRTQQLSLANERLQAEIAQHMVTQHELAKRHHALESLHMLATTVEGTLETLFAEVCKRLAMALDVSFVTVAGLDGNCLNPVTQYDNGEIRHFASLRPEMHICERTIHQHDPHQFCGYLERTYTACPGLTTSDPVSYLGVPIRDQGARLRGTVCVVAYKPRIFSDDDVHVVELFARYAAHEITRDRLERQLRQAQEMKMLGQLTSGVAHEVRNPLNAIQAVTEALMLELGDAETFRPFIDHINTNVRRLTALMQDLLELGRTRHQLSFHTIGLGALVDQAVADWQDSSPHRTRRIVVNGDKNARAVTVHADPIKVRQVFGNLFDNACHHTPEESPIVITLEEPVDRWASVAVIDHGSGIPEPLLSRVLDPFFTTRKGGTGLGLSIVRHIMDIHGGIVSIANNDPPPGVTARVAFPVE